MDKLKMESKDLVNDNIDRIQELFPGVVTESIDNNGRLIRAIDFDLLKQELSDHVVEGEKERYQLTWPGKNKAMLMANLPTTKTLRPAREESVDWDKTENLFIEGDNLEALKILQESYLNQVKCIYIDPPYNTGKDFIYKDDFKQSRQEYLDQSGQVDEEGNRLFQNNESNGRFHSDWLSMMYPRLKLARNLLREDGVIFISIDDNEHHSLRKICDEIFGNSNFVTDIVWKKRVSPANDSQWYSSDHEYLCVFAKTKANWYPNKTIRTDEHNKYYKNTDDDPRGPWNSAAYTCNKSKSERPNLYYAIQNPYTGEKIWPNENAVWAYSQETHKVHVMDNLLYWGANGKSKSPRKKQFLKDAKPVVPRSVWEYSEVGSTQSATTESRSLFGGVAFTYPKSLGLLKKTIYQATNKHDIVVDFFAGSCTAAHAVMQLNAEDKGNRKYIMVQLPEPCPPDSEAHKAGYKNIAEIGKERIRRAAGKIKEEIGADIDYGFRVFKVDSSNMKDVYHHPQKTTQKTLLDLVSNIKEDRSAEDLLIQVMLDSGLQPSLPMEKNTIQGKEVFFVAGNSLVACFDKDIPEQLIHDIAGHKPLRVVFQDKSFKDDAARINVDELFKTLSQGTEVKVI